MIGAVGSLGRYEGCRSDVLGQLCVRDGMQREVSDGGNSHRGMGWKRGGRWRCCLEYDK